MEETEGRRRGNTREETWWYSSLKDYLKKEKMKEEVSEM